jgi:hypothetical protein
VLFIPEHNENKRDSDRKLPELAMSFSDSHGLDATFRQANLSACPSLLTINVSYWKVPLGGKLLSHFWWTHSGKIRLPSILLKDRLSKHTDQKFSNNPACC